MLFYRETNAKSGKNLLDSDYGIYMVRLLVATINWHKSLQFVKKSNIVFRLDKNLETDDPSKTSYPSVSTS